MNSEKISKLEERLKVFQEDMINTKTSYNEFEENLFSHLNSYLKNTDTLKKYSNYLIENYSSENMEENKNSSSEFLYENIFSLNTELIDKIMLILIEKLSKSYELNEIFQDELKDLAQFEKEELSRVQKRYKMKSELYSLQKKHGPNLNILYDDFQGQTEEIKNDVRNFKKKYMEEIESELDIKFKSVFKLLVDKSPKKMNKFDDPVEFENDQKYIEKFEQIKNKIMEEIRSMQNGTFKSLENKEEKSDEELRLENTIRTILQRKFLGIEPTYGNMLPKFDDDDVPDVLQQMLIPKKVYKGHKVPNEDEKKIINRRLKRFYDLINYSKTESTMFPKEKVDVLKEKFLEYFGRYNDIIYPDGFRHLESFEMYQSVFPLRTMADYISECKKINKYIPF